MKDMMVVNGYIAWNMKAMDDSIIHNLTHAHFVAIYADELLTFTDNNELSQAAFVNMYEEYRLGNKSMRQQLDLFLAT